MKLPIALDYSPMEAESVSEIPSGDEWAYEPKWDGFRCLAFRDGDEVQLVSKAGKPLGRYFPDLVESLLRLGAKRFVLDGEIVIPVHGLLSFDELLLRIHPAARRVKALAAANPASLIVFDLLLGNAGGALVGRPYHERRARLESFAGRFFRGSDAVRLSPVTLDRDEAAGWLDEGQKGLDGVIAKRRDLAYRSGDRTGMRKIKKMRTAECVVGGFRYGSRTRDVGSLLLGLYGDDGLLHHVGFCSSIGAKQRKALTPKLEKLRGGPGFTGKAPGGPSRWSTERTGEWEPLRTELVVEVQYDHFSGGRFRHGTGFVRWRPDKDPRQCRMAQVERESRSSMRLLDPASR